MNKILIAAVLALTAQAAGAQDAGTTLPPPTPEEGTTPPPGTIPPPPAVPYQQQPVSPAEPPAGRPAVGAKSTLDMTPAVTLTDDERFARFDVNADGSLSPDEVAANAELSHRFRALDRNGDGKLSKSEFAMRNKDMSRH